MLKSRLVMSDLVGDIVLLQNFHLGELVLIDKCLFEHGARYERKHAILTAFEDLRVFPLRLLLLNHVLVAVIRSQRDRAWVLRILALIVMYLQGTHTLTICATSHVWLVVHYHHARAGYYGI